jgi:hypothetical protein
VAALIRSAELRLHYAPEGGLRIEDGAIASGSSVPLTRDAAGCRPASAPPIRIWPRMFRLGSAHRIQGRVSFPNGGPDQTPGVIVMAIDDRVGRDLDPELDGVVVVFNASPRTTSQTVGSLAGRRYSLHPVQAGGGDPVVRISNYQRATGMFMVPARTVAVFVGR